MGGGRGPPGPPVAGGHELLLLDGSVSIHHRNIQRLAIEMYKAKNHTFMKHVLSHILDREELRLLSTVLNHFRFWVLKSGI